MLFRGSARGMSRNDAISTPPRCPLRSSHLDRRFHKPLEHFSGLEESQNHNFVVRLIAALTCIFFDIETN